MRKRIGRHTIQKKSGVSLYVYLLIILTLMVITCFSMYSYSIDPLDATSKLSSSHPLSKLSKTNNNNLETKTNIVDKINTNKDSNINGEKSSITNKPKSETLYPVIKNFDPKPLPKSKGKSIGKGKKNEPYDFHFVHIPKCGGTSMTAILRQITCKIDESRNNDCCTNPGFCDWHAKRRCTAIKGCINHIPQRKWVFKYPKSITILREPVSRLISAFHYRGHSPNLDFFSVRPEFKEIKQGRKPKVTFDEYIEMPEYQNIQTRMLGADSFPYRNVTVNEKVFIKAVEALNAFFFVGLQEVYDLSVELMQRELHTDEKDQVPVKNERNNNSGPLKKKKAAIKNNQALMDRTRQLNDYDERLYFLARDRFCITLKKYPDLYAKLDKKKVQCL